MILLDTNVISEQFRAVPDETVIGWLNRQPMARRSATIGEVGNDQGASCEYGY